MTDQLTPQQIKEYRESFAMFDQNGNGLIDARELGSVMRRLGLHPSDMELHDIIKDIDCDGDGTVDFGEFITMLARKQQHVDTLEELRLAFQVFDENGNGYISLNELRHVVAKVGEHLTPEELENMIGEADLDGDGKISYQEFVAMMTKK